MHHLIIVNVEIDRDEGVVELLDLQGVACDRHVPLLDIIQLLVELKFPCNRVGREDFLEVPPLLLQHFGLSAKHVIMNK